MLPDVEEIGSIYAPFGLLSSVLSDGLSACSFNSSFIDSENFISTSVVAGEAGWTSLPAEVFEADEFPVELLQLVETVPVVLEVVDGCMVFFCCLALARRFLNQTCTLLSGN